MLMTIENNKFSGLTTDQLKGRVKLINSFCKEAKEHFAPDIAQFNDVLIERGLGAYTFKWTEKS